MNPQRSYRAACPQCGAPVEFRSAASALAVCSYCGSTLLREGESLRRIGRMAELFDDHSPIRIGSSGRLPADLAPFFAQPAEAAFTVVGRLQWRYADGRWSEWSLLLDDGQTLWLSEDNGRYALSRVVSGSADAAPPFARLSDGSLAPGRLVNVGGRAFEITNLVAVEIQALEGELPSSALEPAREATDLEAGSDGASAGAASGVTDPPDAMSDAPPAPAAAPSPAPPSATPPGPPPGYPPAAGAPAPISRTAPAAPAHWILEGRSTAGVILSIDYGAPSRPVVSMGRPVELKTLQWRDLADESTRAIDARAFNCPACGAPIEVKLPGILSVVCPSCASVIELAPSKGDAQGPQANAGAGTGAGATAAEDLGYFRQQRRYTPPIPLGSKGRLFDIEWQAVGFARRSGRSEEGFDFTWRETLLWHPVEGFAFVVLASDGMSFVRTIQDAPEMLGRRGARYQGRIYRAEEPYVARVDYVEGEFYWRVRRDQLTENIDYLNGSRLLSRELERFTPTRSARRGHAGGAPGTQRHDAGDAASGPEAGEVVWSAGERISRSTLIQAFGLPANALLGPDVSSPIPGGGDAGAGPADAPAYDPDDMPLGLDRAGARAAGTAGALGAGAAGASGGAGAGPVSGSLGVIGVIVIVLIILVIVFLLVNSGGGGSSSGWGGGGGYSGSHK